jgi:Mn-dependent DtxR family transcriptional regulator
MTTEEVLRRDDLTPYSKLLYRLFTENEEYKNKGNGVLARLLGTNSITILRSIKHLKDKGLIDVRYGDNGFSKCIIII